MVFGQLRKYFNLVFTMWSLGTVPALFYCMGLFAWHFSSLHHFSISFTYLFISRPYKTLYITYLCICHVTWLFFCLITFRLHSLLLDRYFFSTYKSSSDAPSFLYLPFNFSYSDSSFNIFVWLRKSSLFSFYLLSLYFFYP